MFNSNVCGFSFLAPPVPGHPRDLFFDPLSEQILDNSIFLNGLCINNSLSDGQLIPFRMSN